MLKELLDFSFSLPAAFAQHSLRIWFRRLDYMLAQDEASALDCIFGCAGE